jgi:hypothetical protein
MAGTSEVGRAALFRRISTELIRIEPEFAERTYLEDATINCGGCEHYGPRLQAGHFERVSGKPPKPEG